MKTMFLAAAALLVSVPAAAGIVPSMVSTPAIADNMRVTPAAFGDLPVSGGHRRGRRQQRDSKPSAPPEARTEPQGETPEQHKAYLKRYGF